jgi:hypothetical protein
MNESLQIENLPFNNSKLGFFYNICAIAFAASFIGLGINLFINFELPYTHLFFLGGILLTIISGTTVNILDKKWAQMNTNFQINNLLNTRQDK